MILREFSAALSHTCRVCDIPCRSSANQFSIILPETAVTQSIPFINRFQSRLDMVFDDFRRHHQCDSLPMMTNYGVCSSEQALAMEANSAEDIISRTGLALKRAKDANANTGQHQIGYYDWNLAETKLLDHEIKH